MKRNITPWRTDREGNRSRAKVQRYKEREMLNGGYSSKVRAQKGGGHRKARETLSAQCMQWNECPFLHRKFFLCSGLQGLLVGFLFSELSPSLTFPSRMCRSWLHEQKEKWTSSSLGDWKGRWSPNALPATALWDRQVPPKPVRCESKRDLAMDYEGQWQKAGTLKQWLILQGSSRNIPFVCSVQVCGLAGVWNFRFGDIPQAQVFFFKGTKQALAQSTPSSMALNTVGTGNSSCLTMAQWPEALKATTKSIVEQMTSQSGWTPRLFLLKKKEVRSHHREKERKKESKKENEWKKRIEKKQQQLKPHESSLRKRSKSTSAWPPRPKSCRQESVAEASGAYSQVVQRSSVFVQRYYTGEKKRKRGTREM